MSHMQHLRSRHIKHMTQDRTVVLHDGAIKMGSYVVRDDLHDRVGNSRLAVHDILFELFNQWSNDIKMEVANAR